MVVYFWVVFFYYYFVLFIGILVIFLDLSNIENGRVFILWFFWGERKWKWEVVNVFLKDF